MAIAGFTIAGLGCATIYPIYISWFSHWYGAGRATIGRSGFLDGIAWRFGAAVARGLCFHEDGQLADRIFGAAGGDLMMVAFVTLLRKRGLQML